MEVQAAAVHFVIIFSIEFQEKPTTLIYHTLKKGHHEAHVVM